jgi:hypothetical protein
VVGGDTGNPICDECGEDVRDVKCLPPAQPDERPVTEKLTWADT